MHHPHRSPRRLIRRGAVVLELILCLPILIIGLFAIVELGILRANQQRLEAASRLGALLASESLPLPADDAAFAASPIVDAIKRQLQLAAWDTSDPNLLIRLEHNVGGSLTVLQAGALVCPPPEDEPPPPAVRQYVRLTICASIIGAKMTPNLLKTYCYDLEGWVTQQTTTLRYEWGTTP